MWSKRKDEEAAPKPIQPAQTPAYEPVRREANTMSSPTRSFDPEPVQARAGTAAVLGKNVTVKGQIISREDLTVDGEVEGTIECHEHRLTIGPNARVQAALKAREVVIYGSIQGNVEAADKIDIKKEAKLVGDIKTTRIMIEDGAYFKGSIDITKNAQPARPPAPGPAPATGQTVPVPAPAPVTTVPK